MYESGTLVATAPAGQPDVSWVVVDYRDYSVQVSLLNAVGEGALSAATVINFPAPITEGVPSQPDAPTLDLVEDGPVVQAPATVVKFDANGQPAGVGPASDPNGVFYGVTDLNSNEVWWASKQPAGTIVTPWAGGRFTWTPTGKGQQTLEWTRQNTITLAAVSGSKTFTS